MLRCQILIYLHYSGYSIHHNIPFSVSGENLIILAQNFVIVGLIWKFNRKITKLEKYILSAFFLSYSIILLSDRFLSDKHWNLIAKSNIIFCKNNRHLIYIVLLSRLPQIIINFRNKSTGQLSFLSFLLSFAGYAARLTTVLIETDDLLYRLQHVTGTLLTGMLIA